jgi:hypothetical protein
MSSTGLFSVVRHVAHRVSSVQRWGRTGPSEDRTVGTSGVTVSR